MNMRNQNKSVVVVAQPNLLHMWNMKNSTAKNGEEDGNVKGVDDIRETLEANTDINNSTARSHTAKGNLSVSTETALCGAQTGTENSSIITQPEIFEKHDETRSFCSSDNGLARCPELNEGGNKDSNGLQSRKLRPRARENSSHASGGKRQAKPFPIFERREAQHANAITEATPAIGKIELPKQSQKTGKIMTMSNRSGQAEHRTSDHLLSSTSQITNKGKPSGLPRRISTLPKDVVENTQVDKISEPTYKGSQEEPIVVDSSPTREQPEYIILESSPSPTKPSRTVLGNKSCDFFAPRKQNPSFTSAKVRRKIGEGEYAKWPSKDSQHVRGVQHPFPNISRKSFGLQPKPYKGGSSSHFSESYGRLHSNDGSSPNYELPRCPIEVIDSQSDGPAKRREILRSKASCPAISRFLDSSHNTSGSSWNERWRPRNANEVVGNEAQSIYIRDWLLALEIKADGQSAIHEVNTQGSLQSRATKSSQGTKRTQVIRTVDKPRKRRRKVDSDEESQSDRITSDDEDDIMPPYACFESEDELFDKSKSGSPWKPKLSRLSRGRPLDHDDDEIHANAMIPSAPASVHDFSDRLTNTILLSGPTGSGKTAAVYACAEELGWEVFEVYPGIGKRNGTSLLSLVGDVGKNHIVNLPSRGVANTHEQDSSNPNATSQSSVTSKDDRSKGASRPSFFSQWHKRPTASGARGSDSIDTEQATVPSDNVGPSKLASFQSSLGLSSASGGASTSTEDVNSKLASTRQSIILLEEVDILFGEDVNFWPTVIALIRESRRPVIMTCNDPSLVPSASLPLQTILSFRPCPVDLAISYLRCAALVEGYIVSEEHVKSLYERAKSLDVLDHCDDFLRSATYPSSCPDLRHAINSLQFACQGRSGCNDISLLTESDIAYPNACSSSALDRARSWDWNQCSIPNLSPVGGDETDVSGPAMRLREITNIWQISDRLSMIDGYLARKQSDELQLASYPSGDPFDNELGYPCLDCDTEDSHLQNGIVLYNYDDTIATEAVTCAGRVVGINAAGSGTDLIRGVRSDGERWKLPSADLLRHASGHFARVSCVLGKIVPVVLKQRVGSLVLDYEPWVRTIDRSDMDWAAAALKENETRTGARGGRSTRNSQRMQYERYFDLDEDERKDWHGSGFAENVAATLCGEDGCK